MVKQPKDIEAFKFTVGGASHIRTWTLIWTDRKTYDDGDEPFLAYQANSKLYLPIHGDLEKLCDSAATFVGFCWETYFDRTAETKRDTDWPTKVRIGGRRFKLELSRVALINAFHTDMKERVIRVSAPDRDSAVRNTIAAVDAGWEAWTEGVLNKAWKRIIERKTKAPSESLPSEDKQKLNADFDAAMGRIFTAHAPATTSPPEPSVAPLPDPHAEARQKLATIPIDGKGRLLCPHCKAAYKYLRPFVKHVRKGHEDKALADALGSPLVTDWLKAIGK